MSAADKRAVSSRAVSSRARDRARHEAEILEAAERLFARKGYVAATIVEIASEAGFAIATLYNLFGSKDAIRDRLLEVHLAALTRETDAAVSRARTPRQKLEAHVLARARYLAEHRDFFLLYLNEGSDTTATLDRDAAVACAIRRQTELLEQLFRELGARGLDPATRALVFFGATRAWLVEKIVKSRRPPRPRDVGLVVRALLDGLASGSRQ